MAAWLEVDDWVYEVFDKDTPASQFRQFEPFKALWDSKRIGDALPAWKDFQFEDFAPWYGWLIVEDVIATNPYDSHYRLWGTHVTTLYNADLTGRKMSDLRDTLFDEEEFDLGDVMVKGQLASISTGPMKWKELEHKVFSTLELPLSDDGHTVDKVIALVSELVRPTDL